MRERNGIMSKICLDNTFVSDYIDGREYTKRYLLDHIGRTEVFVPYIIMYESAVPVYMSKYERTIEDVKNNLSGFKLVSFDKEKVKETAKIRAHIKQRDDKSCESPDLLIAGIARSIGATVVTSNVDDFEDVPNLDIENPR